MFPPKMAAGADPLGQPPPSPTPMNPDGQGMTAPSLRGMAGPGGGPGAIPTGQIPKEMLTGITAAATQIASMLDAFAQATPEQGGLLEEIKGKLQEYLAAVMVGGSTAVGPTASGSAFPGGGMTRGIAGAGAI